MRRRSLRMVDVSVALLVSLDHAQTDVGTVNELRLQQAERFSLCAQLGRGSHRAYPVSAAVSR